jgi:predicted O-methyltransferase YrrM
MHIRDFRPDEVFRSETSDREWPEVAARIDAITQIDDGKTGGVNPGDRRALYYLVRWLQPSSVLEIGTHVGASTLYIAAALRRQQVARLTTVDIVDVNAADSYWSKAGLSKPPSDALAELGASVDFVQSDSVSFLERASDKFDLIFLDGDHSQAKVLAEITVALKRLREDGLILLHDYFPNRAQYWPGEPLIDGPYQAVKRLRKEGMRVIAVPFGELPWPTKGGTNLTSLAALLSS